MVKRSLIIILLMGVFAAISHAEQTLIPIPDQGWHIVIDAPPLKQKEETKGPDNYEFRANNEQFNLSLFVQNARSRGGNKGCYELYWPWIQRSPLTDKNSVRVTSP